MKVGRFSLTEKQQQPLDYTGFIIQLMFFFFQTVFEIKDLNSLFNQNSEKNG